MADLTDLITEEQFQVGEEQRLAHREQQYLTSIEYIPQIHQQLISLTEESTSEIRDYEFANKMVDISCIRRYYTETHKQEKLDELNKKTSGILQKRATQFGKLGLLFYEHRQLTRQEFIEALKQDLVYIEQHENEDNSEAKTNAARHLWSAMEFSSTISLKQLTNGLKSQHTDLLKYYLSSKLLWPK